MGSTNSTVKRGPDGHRIRPPHVVDAILNRDTEKLRAMQRASVRARKLSAEEQRRAEEQAASEAVAASKKAKQASDAEDALKAFDEASARRKQARFLRDAKAHANANRIGWDDDYRL